MLVERFTVPDGFPQKVEQVLPMILPVHPLRAHDTLLDRRAVKINGRSVSRGRKVHAGDVIEVHFADVLPVPRVAGGPIEVLADAHGLMIVNKPAGLVVDEESTGPRANAPRGTGVVTLLAGQLTGFSVGGFAAPGVAHRIDRETSGCVSLARTDGSLFALQRAFAEKCVEKKYLAIVEGRPPAQGEFDTAYGPRENNRRLFTTKIDTPRRARLSFVVREQFANAACVEIALDTGRTHQIRVQFSEAGFPVLGDSLYGAGPTEVAPRVMLHAASLSIALPNVELLKAVAPVPADFESALQRHR